jgi:hypothetical protein
MFISGSNGLGLLEVDDDDDDDDDDEVVEDDVVDLTNTVSGKGSSFPCDPCDSVSESSSEL